MERDNHGDSIRHKNKLTLLVSHIAYIEYSDIIEKAEIDQCSRISTDSCIKQNIYIKIASKLEEIAIDQIS